MDLKMEVYSPFLELMGVLEQYKSIIWEDKAFSAGSFSVDALLTERTRALLVPNHILWIEGDTAGIIEFIEEAADSSAYITVKGRLLTGILDFFILYGQYELNGTVPSIMRQLVNDTAIAPTRWDAEARKVPNLVLAEAADGGQTIRTQKTGGSLLEALEELGEAYQTPFGIRFNPAVPQMEFWARPGVDRSVRQNVNDQVVYSTELDDILSSEYSYNSTDWRNVAAVAGEGEGGSRVMITVEDNTEPSPEPPEPAVYTISLSVDPEGGGLASGGGAFSSGQSVTVTAAPSSGYLFSGWRENGVIVSTEESYTFTAAGDRSLTAVFEVSIPVYTIAVTVSPEGGGTVTGAGRYQEGEAVTLAAEPAEGYKFSGWQENGQTVSADATYSFTASANRVFVVAFAEKPASRLPEGYTEVEYIHWSSPFGFDTGLIATPSKTRLVFDMEMGAYASSYEYLFREYGLMGSSTNNYDFSIYRRTEAQFTIMAAGNPTYVTVSTGSVTGQRIQIDFNGPSKTCSIGDSSFNISVSTIAFKTAHLFVGAINNLGKVPDTKLYSCQIYNSGLLKFDFVPCTNASGVAGLFDLVGNEFYSNKFSGTVTAGPAI